MDSNHLILCHSLLLLPSTFPNIKVYSSESVISIRWPKYWRFSFNISPSNEYSGLISFRIKWLDLLVFQETLKNLLQHHSSKASIFQCSASFIVQLSHPYITTWKIIALTGQIFVSKVMSLFFNMLFRFFIAFLQSCPTLCDPIECSLPGSSVHAILQARILEWGAWSSSGPVLIPQPGPLCPWTTEWSPGHATASRATPAREGHLPGCWPWWNETTRPRGGEEDQWGSRINSNSSWTTVPRQRPLEANRLQTCC